MASKKLWVRWNNREKDHKIQFPDRTDGHFIHGALFYPRYTFEGTRVLSIAEELEARGYDLKTLTFECSLKEKDDDS